jgi:hypothetical protein
MLILQFLIIKKGDCMVFNLINGLNENIGFDYLNYCVIGGTSEPTGLADKNTIWINTDTPITGHIFSPISPSGGKEGMIWLKYSYIPSIAKLNIIAGTENQVIIPIVNAA